MVDDFRFDGGHKNVAQRRVEGELPRARNSAARSGNNSAWRDISRSIRLKINSPVVPPRMRSCTASTATPTINNNTVFGPAIMRLGAASPSASRANTSRLRLLVSATMISQFFSSTARRMRCVLGPWIVRMGGLHREHRRGTSTPPRPTPLARRPRHDWRHTPGHAWFCSNAWIVPQ
jgi:hypothetical protein